MKKVFVSRMLALALIGCPLGGFMPVTAEDGVAPADTPVVEVLATDPTALVGASSGAFTLVRTGAGEASLTVLYTLSGAATNGVDYVQIANEIIIPSGFLAADVVIEPVADSPNRGNKTIILTLETNANYRLERHKRATVTLVDDIYNDKAPAVNLASPAEGAVFTLPANVTIEAAATDPDDRVQRVSFFADDRHLGRVTAPPFVLTWTNPPAGEHTLFARAVDAFGKSTLSAPIHITIKADLPVVTLLSPKEDDTISMPGDVKIEADVKPGSGSIVKVQIYCDRRLLKTLDQGPYTFVWEDVRPGEHQVTVRATDAFGSTATAKVSFKVVNQPPVVKVIAPKDGDNFTARGNITLQAEASDPDGTIERVSFYANSRHLGTVATSPYTLVWKKVPAGVYKIKASATDEHGSRVVSDAVLISVSR